jgi:hypothetical protein
MNTRRGLTFSVGLLGLLWLMLPNAARADTFDWTYTPSGGNLSLTGSGTLTTSGTTTGSYGSGLDITAITGVFDGQSITGISLPPSCAFGCDDILYYPATTNDGPGLPVMLDDSGITFTLADGDAANIYFDPFSTPAEYAANCNAACSSSATGGTFTVAVPEIDPSTGLARIALLGGVVLILRGRRTKETMAR